MSTHVPASLWVALVAASTVVMLLSGIALARARAVAALLAWLALDAGLGVAGVFAASRGTFLPGIVPGIALPLVVGIWLQVRPGYVRDLAASIPLARLVGVQLYRVAGVVFLLAWAQGLMPAEFALPAGIGDIAVGVAAPIAAAGLRRRPAWRRLAIAWNVAGVADLVVAVALGFLTSPSPFEQLALGSPNVLITRMPFVLIPTFAVPLSILLHVAALRRLLASPAPAQPAATTRGADLAAASPWAR